MRRFAIFAPGCAGQDLNSWLDAGFQLWDNGTVNVPEEPPDVMFWRWQKEGTELWQSVQCLQPKLFVITHSHEVPVPDALSGIYEKTVISNEGLWFTLGSKLQGPVTEPRWEVYRNESRLTRGEQVKAVADSVYRYLLEDVFRETAEWCGHMSSVVGPG